MNARCFDEMLRQLYLPAVRHVRGVLLPQVRLVNRRFVQSNVEGGGAGGGVELEKAVVPHLALLRLVLGVHTGVRDIVARHEGGREREMEHKGRVRRHVNGGKSWPGQMRGSGGSSWLSERWQCLVGVGGGCCELRACLVAARGEVKKAAK